MSDPLIMGILLAVLLGLLAMGVWVAVALLSVGVVAMVFFTSAPVGQVLATTIWGQSHSWALAALPLFILMGEILLRSRLSEDMFKGLSPWLGRLPGRLLHVNILGCAIFAAVSGSSAATAATIGKMTVPELEKRGYPRRLVIGTLAGSATLGLLIPPSIILIVYGVATDQSIARLFIAGILPGLMLVAMFAGFVMLSSLLRPDDIPEETETFTLWEKIVAVRRLIPVLLVIVGVISSIYTGIASPTDAAALGVVFSLILAWATGSFSLHMLREAIMGATITSTMIA
ncbi:MAG TPA: TRAP transporter large permease subunit, partial [Devosia sp.]|nr:TRAP transporter large permease subunit [Devosia sp.]